MRASVLMVLGSIGTIALSTACGSGEPANDTGSSAGGSSAGSSAGGSSVGGGSSGLEGGSVATGAFGPCGGKIIDAMTGALNADEYNRQARLWDRATINCRLGPKFADLHSAADDGRPTAYEPEHKTASGGYLCPTY